MILREIFKGCEEKVGILARMVGEDKIAFQDNKAIDWDKHESGQLVQGLSPVNTDTWQCRWICLDIDIKANPKEFAPRIFSYIGSNYLCYMTNGSKWRVVERLDDWIDVDEAKSRVEKLEKRVEQLCDYKSDSAHCLPKSWDKKTKSPGAWIFVPEHNETTVLHTPDGRPLSKAQSEFRAEYRNHPLIVSAIGMLGQGNGGSRHKALFYVGLYKVHNPDCDIDLKELNKNFAEPLVDDMQLDNAIKHVEKSALKYDKEYLLKGTPKWIEECCGVRPLINAKDFSVVTQELTKNYIYIRDRKSLYEISSGKFLDRDQLNDWWAHYTCTLPKGSPKQMTTVLLQDERLTKVQCHLTHAGKPEGLIELEDNEVKGLEAGTYLNVYKPGIVEAVEGDVSRLNHYFDFALGPKEWLLIKQLLAFMLLYPGEKAQWFIIIQGKVQGIGKKLLAQIVQKMLGTRNVRPNVSFKKLVNDHSTLLEGAQCIFLNEVSVSNNTGIRKELTEVFKDFITDDNFIINPKGLPQVEIVNLCNFFCFSNSKTPLHIDEEDRRTAVISVKRSKPEITNILKNEGYVQDLLQAIQDPSAFKWHLINEIGKDLDYKMFFDAPPMTEDKENMLEANKGEFDKIMDMNHEGLSFPFGSKVNRDGTNHYMYKGLINLSDTYKAMMKDETFRQSRHMYWGITELTDRIKKLSLPWRYKGEQPVIKKQIKSVRGYLQVYLTHNFTDNKGKRLSDMSEGELGKLYDSQPSTDELNKMSEDMSFESIRPDYTNKCWACKTHIELNQDTICSDCNYAIMCECGKCACDKPGNEHMKKKREHY